MLTVSTRPGGVHVGSGAVPQPATTPPPGATLPTGESSAPARRIALAQAIVRTLRAAIIDPLALDLVIDAGRASASPPSRPAAVGPAPGRVVIRGPDALGRLLPPTQTGSRTGSCVATWRSRVTWPPRSGAGPPSTFAACVSRTRVGSLRWGWELWRAAPRAGSLQRVSRVSGRRHSRARDMAAIRFHYDVGDAFFGLWLDRRHDLYLRLLPGRRHGGDRRRPPGRGPGGQARARMSQAAAGARAAASGYRVGLGLAGLVRR